jgi:hypothetical protein
MSNVLIRNVEAVFALAYYEKGYVTAAWVNARAAFELSVRIVWLLFPDDRYQSECRWLALLAEAEKYHYLVASETAVSSPDTASEHRLHADAIRAFRLDVTNRLPAGYTPDLKVPKMKFMMEDLGVEKLYQYYRQGSQYVHGTSHATTAYRKNLGTMVEWGEFTSLSDWVLPIRLSWLSFKESMRFVIDRHDPSGSHPDWTSIGHEVDIRFRVFAQQVTDSV